MAKEEDVMGEMMKALRNQGNDDESKDDSAAIVECMEAMQKEMSEKAEFDRAVSKYDGAL